MPGRVCCSCCGECQGIPAGVWKEERAPRLGLDPAHSPRGSGAAAPPGLGLPAGTLQAQVCSRAEVGPHQHRSCLVWDLRNRVCHHHMAFGTGRAQLKRAGNAALLEPEYPCMSEEDKESG